MSESNKDGDAGMSRPYSELPPLDSCTSDRESSGEPNSTPTDGPPRTPTEHVLRNQAESGRSRTPMDGSVPLCKQGVRGSIPLSSTEGD
jgi:hypothetical protein